MKKIIIIYYHLLLASLASMLFAGNVNFETGWEYTQPTLQSFYIIETINIDGEEAEGYIDNSSECVANPYSCDVAGAFIVRDETVNGQDINGDEEITSDAEVCVGWTYVESAGWTTIPLFGDDGSDYSSGYMEFGDVPFLKIYDHSNHSIISADISGLTIFESFQDCLESECDTCYEDGLQLNGSPCVGNGTWDDSFEGEPFVDCDIDDDGSICEGDDGWNSAIHGNGEWDDIEFDDVNGNGEWDADEGEFWFDEDQDGYPDLAEDFIDCGYNDDMDYICEDQNGWDSSFGNGVYDSPVTAEEFDDYNNNGLWDGLLEGELAVWANNSIAQYYGTLNANNVYGCKDDGSYSVMPDSYFCDIDGDYFLDSEECADNCNTECLEVYQSANLWESQYDAQYSGYEACNNDTVNFPTADDGSCVYPPNGDVQIEYAIIDGNNLEVTWVDPELGTDPFYHHVRIFSDVDEVFNQFDPDSPIYVENLTYSTDYTIEIITTNLEVCGELETIVDSVSTNSMPPPGQVVVTDIIPGEGHISLMWEPVDFASTYSVESNGLIIDEVQETWYYHNELSPDLTIEYQIVAINAEGAAGAPSESVFGSTDPLSQVTLDSIVVGQAKLDLTWSMDNGELEYNNENFVYDVYMNDELIFEGRQGTYYTANDLSPGETYCFEIVPRVELIVDGQPQEFSSTQSNEQQCGSPAPISGWSILIHAELDAWGSELVVDEYNEIGMKPEPEASDGYDPDLDIFEPPAVGELDWPLSLSFPHPEWNIGIGGTPQNYFTTDIRSLKDLSKSLEIWDGVISCNAPGNGELIFNYIEAGNYPVFFKWENQYSVVQDDISVDYIYNTPGEYSNFKLIVGNQSPTVPMSLNVSQSDTISRAMDLIWDPIEVCEGSSDACNDYSNRYPPHSYKIYRGWYEEIEPHLIGFAGTSESKISFFPHQLFAPSEDMFSIVEQPVNGYISSLFYESEDECLSGDFIDCGWDGLCTGDPGYEAEEYDDYNGNGIYDLGENFIDFNENGIWDENGPDVGENDGVCNVVYFYSPYSNVSNADDSFSFSNGIYDIGEDFLDCNSAQTICEGDEGWDNTFGNTYWDEGEPYVDSRKVKIQITENLETYFMDTELKTGTVYNYNVSAVNDAGESGLSIMDSEQTEDNFNPVADAGVDQKRYLVSIDDDFIECTFPLDNVYEFYTENGQPIGEECEFELGCNFSGEEEIDGPLDFGDVLPLLDEEGFPILEHHRCSDNQYDNIEECEENGETWINNNNSYDPDGLSTESLQYFWEIYDPNDTIDESLEPSESNEAHWFKFSSDEMATINLRETTDFPDLNYNGIDIIQEYLVRLYVKDVSNYSSSEVYTTIEVTRDIPWPAQVEMNDPQESLYYIKINWNESSYEPDDPFLEGYDGILELADEYHIYRDGEHHATVESDVLYYVDSGLTPSEEFNDLNGNGVWDCFEWDGDECVDGELLITDDDGDGIWDATESHSYYIVAVNSSGPSDPSEEYTYSTGALPVPVITAPSGGEILATGDVTTITWEISSSIVFIDNITVLHSYDSGQNWEELDSWESNEIPVYFDFNVPVTDTISFYNKFKVEVTDIGDYSGLNQVIHDDVTDHLIIIANDDLENNFIPGWNLMSSPLELEVETIYGNFTVEDDDFSDFFIYNQDDEVCGIPSCHDPDLYFQTGEGYYLFSQDQLNLGLQGELLSDGYTISLDEGWNLIGNPLVARVIVDSIMVGVELPEDDCEDFGICSDANQTTAEGCCVAGEGTWSNETCIDGENVWTYNLWVDDDENYPLSEGQCYYSWEAAVRYDKVMPTLQNFNSDIDVKCHMPSQILEPFSGYWIHANSPLNIRVEPHIYDESFYNDRDDRDLDWTLSLFAAEHNPNPAMVDLLWNDMIKIGLGSNYSNGFSYGEDEFEIPIAVNPASFTNMYINQPAWEDAGAETDRYFSDFRFLEGADTTKVWNLSGQLLGSVLEDSILLSWTMENESIIPDHIISLTVDTLIYNMKEQSSVVIHKHSFEYMAITVGQTIDENSCETQGFATCPDGSCSQTSDIGDCTCEQQLLDSCPDGSCAISVEECSCESQGLETCLDGTCIDPGEECSCESEGLIECEDGTCAETVDDCVDDLSNMIPEEFSISRPYPNPFNPVVRVDYSLPMMDNVVINIYDINGLIVERIQAGFVEAGYHEVSWNADRHPSGIYFIQFLSNHENRTMKIMLVK